MIKQEQITWHSEQLDKDMTVRIYGKKGVPVLAFPRSDCMSDNWEKHGMVECLKDYLEDGKLQLFTVDSVDAETWNCENGIDSWRSARQESYFLYIIEEVLPFMKKKNHSKKLPIVTGACLGANEAAITFLRRPDLFQAVIALSGLYDVRFFFDDYMDSTLYDNAPERFLENMPPDHPYIKMYNDKKMIFCVGQGSQEFDGVRTLQNLERIFIIKSIDAWCDYWGFDVDHDWAWWKKQMLYFLPYVLGEKLSIH